MKRKALINIGIFSVIYFAIVFVAAMLWSVPVFLLLSVPLLGGLIGRKLMDKHLGKAGMV